MILSGCFYRLSTGSFLLSEGLLFLTFLAEAIQGIRIWVDRIIGHCLYSLCILLGLESSFKLGLAMSS